MSEVSHGIKPSCARRSQVYSRLSQLWTVHPRTLIDKKASCKAGLCYWGMTPMDIKNTLTTERPHKYLCYKTSVLHSQRSSFLSVANGSESLVYPRVTLRQTDPRDLVGEYFQPAFGDPRGGGDRKGIEV